MRFIGTPEMEVQKILLSLFSRKKYSVCRFPCRISKQKFLNILSMMISCIISLQILTVAIFSRIIPYCMFKNLKQIARKQTPKFLSTGINAIFCQKQLYFRLENVSILWILLLWLLRLRVILPMLEAAVQLHLPVSFRLANHSSLLLKIESMKMSIALSKTT